MREGPFQRVTGVKWKRQRPGVGVFIEGVVEANQDVLVAVLFNPYEVRPQSPTDEWDENPLLGDVTWSVTSADGFDQAVATGAVGSTVVFQKLFIFPASFPNYGAIQYNPGKVYAGNGFWAAYCSWTRTATNNAQQIRFATVFSSEGVVYEGQAFTSFLGTDAMQPVFYPGALTNG